MAMTRKHWSINALSTEFGLDRRTVGSRIKHVAPAATVRGASVWYLADVAPELAPSRSSPDKRTKGHVIVENIEDRLTGWREIRSRPRREMTVPEFAELIGVDDDIVLQRLRAGMPYRTAGDFETGEGFSIDTGYALDWIVTSTFLVHSAGRSDLAHALEL